MVLENLGTITGDGSTHPLSTGLEKSKIVGLTADANNGANITIGGAGVTSSTGVPIVPGQGYFLPSISDPYEFWNLKGIFYNAQSGDKLYVVYGTEGNIT
jgi:hypothetical protein